MADAVTLPDDGPRVELRGICKHFGAGASRVDALADIALTVRAGETVGLRGPSGSGKSTLLNVIGCVTEPSSGWMRLDGEPVYDGRWLRSDLRRLRLFRIGFIFQTHNLLSFLDSTENIAEAMELAGVRPHEARARAVALLDYLGVGHRARAYPGELSGGEAQRVAIARALANGPRIILADEPTAPLDSARAGAVMDLLRRIARDQQAAVLVVTHDETIFDRFDRLISMRDGRIEGEEVFARADGVP
ncbi:MAG: ABC transporter ATP-binding protein [Rhodospirillales bacterium]|nr:ABC transporter ATP-binding protein [Rhodospirillales bacterium]